MPNIEKLKDGEGVVVEFSEDEDEVFNLTFDQANLGQAVQRPLNITYAYNFVPIRVNGTDYSASITPLIFNRNSMVLHVHAEAEGPYVSYLFVLTCIEGDDIWDLDISQNVIRVSGENEAYLDAYDELSDIEQLTLLLAPCLVVEREIYIRSLAPQQPLLRRVVFYFPSLFYTNTMKKHDVLDHAMPHYDEDQLLELDHAIDFATKAHEGQKRKSGEPYIIHPLSVADTLIDWGMDIDSVLAGVLHDTVEDTDATLDEIENLFGRDVAFLVDGVTKVSQARAGMRDLESYLPQTKDNLSKLLIAVGQDVRVIIIKLADRLHNLSTLQYMSKAKQVKIARESLEVFAPMADRLGMGRVRVQIEELAFSYLDPVEYKRLSIAMKKRLGRSTRKLGTVRKEVEGALATHHLQGTIDGRVKSIYSLYKKLKKVDGNIDDIYDLMALRVVVKTKEDCYKVLGILHSMYQPMLSRIKDYIAIPKPNGYQSLHTTVITPNKQIVEFQIRTYGMHEFAERGLAASFHYHEQKDSKDYVKNKRKASALPTHLQWITQLQEVASKLGRGAEISRDQLDIDLFSDQIFVFSPKGDIYNLPEGALPLDFAFLVHSDVGKHAYSFKVNGNIHPFDKPLRNGDVVEVVTRKLVQPKRAWLDLVKTTHAREKLRSQLKKLEVLETLSGAAAYIKRKTIKPKK